MDAVLDIDCTNDLKFGNIGVYMQFTVDWVIFALKQFLKKRNFIAVVFNCTIFMTLNRKSTKKLLLHEYFSTCNIISVTYTQYGKFFFPLEHLCDFRIACTVQTEVKQPFHIN